MDTMTSHDQPRNEYEIVCYHCSSIQNYTLQNPSKFPKRPKKECSKCHKTIYMEITIEEGQIKITPVKQPEQKNKSKVCTKSPLKEPFHDNYNNKVDPELVAMTDKEMIRHTCRAIISTKGEDSRLRLQASNLLLSFVDKAGKMNEIEGESVEMFKSMSVEDLVKIISRDPQYQKIKAKESERGYIDG